MKSALANFETLPINAARQILTKLGYRSDKFLVGAGSKPQDFLGDFAIDHPFDQAKALVPEWKSADLLFQLTDQELSRESALFTDDSVQRGLLKSYVFIAIELRGSDYARGKFSGIARQINRLFPMPVMVVFKHGDRLTIAVINRRRNKLDDSRDVLEKATLIRDITFAQPHRGHLDILESLALPNLVHPQKKPITDFDTLHAAWEQIFNVELLNERFYRELANWYFWALPQVEFPADLEPDDEKRRATGLIRLLTRLIFCWFLKEKNLIPEKLFHATDLAKMLKGFDPESETSSTYYQAILQNLFFATLNQRMGKDGNGKPYRIFATDEGFAKNRATYDVNNLYRYESLFRDEPDAALAHFADIPFLNGGLFECLDRTEDGTDKKRYLDGFSRNAKKRPHVPDRLFFDSGETADLSTAYGDTKRKAEKVTGLITILNRYKFTIVENTPIDQEIALDPELLGKVFENLLASYNEETKTTARKQTGSFYTPRPIVDYMVDESLKAHLTRALVEKARMKEPDARAGLDLLFAYTEKEHAFTPAEVATLIAAIDALKILDPACGSGAFPMGVLHKLVYILGKLDPDNDRWKQTQLAKLDSAPMREELERAFADNNDDYGRKLYLIENCLYGVDIQPIAIQITKLRFFISLVCDQKTNRNKKDNHGIRPLPNLETKFVAANTLIGLPQMEDDLYRDGRIEIIEKEIESLYHSHFSIQRRDQKLSVQRKIKALRQDLATVLAESLGYISSAKSKHLADWDPFDPQCSADFFDAHWMFGRSLTEGFDIVIGNPPYNAELSDLERVYYKAHYASVSSGRQDTAAIFVELATRVCGTRGVVSYILPYRLFSRKRNHGQFQTWLLTHHVLTDILYLGSDVGFTANDEFMVVKLHCLQDKDTVVRVAWKPDLVEGRDSIVFREIKQKAFLDYGEVNLNLLKYDQALLTKISNGTDALESVCKVRDGIVPHIREHLVSDRKRDNRYVRFAGIAGRYTLQPYCFKCEELWLCYDINEAKKYISDPVELRKVQLREKEIFLSRKIITSQNCATLRGAIDEDKTFVSNSIHSTYLRDEFHDRVILEFILALINSKLLNFYHDSLRVKATDLHPQILVGNLKKLPIKIASKSEQEKIAKLVGRITEAKSVNPDSDTSALEREIDQQVYALYGLTPEEIAIVEGTAP